MEITWTLAILEALAFAVVKAVEGELTHWGVVIAPRLWVYAKALGAVIALVLSQLYPTVPENVLIILSALAVGLGILGYWPEVQKVGTRLKKE